jgi:ATP-dependent helicase/nuclease subunit A
MTLLVDQDQRHRIRTSFDENIIAEAAAGTGKTTELVERIVAILAQGRAQIDQIVAITFTEKAAGELKLRLRSELEQVRVLERSDEPRLRNIERAIERLEEGNVNTIHGFCADLLRERPVEGGVDPMFEPLSESESRDLYEEAFDIWFQQALSSPGEGLRRSLRRRSGDSPSERLKAAGWELLGWRDFTAPWTRPAFDRAGLIDQLLEHLQTFSNLTSNSIRPSSYFHGRTQLARRHNERLRSLESVQPRDYDLAEALLVDLAENRDFCDAGTIPGPQYAPNITREAVESAYESLLSGLQIFTRMANSDLAALLQGELRESLRLYEELKARNGRLDFVDLLLRTRDMLRKYESVRADFQGRFTHICVDEFQDTDPIQAEIILLLVSADPSVTSWKNVRPSPGKLFIVGDPKQSIYRFRRADVGTYQFVKNLLLRTGAILLNLTTSFRSVPSIQNYVNSVFAPLMREDGDTLQASYVPLAPFRTETSEQPTIIALPVPEPYGKRDIAQFAIDRSLPDAVGAFVEWLTRKSGWTVTRQEKPDERIPIEPRHICLLFRRFQSFNTDVTRGYVQALEARNIAHMVVGGKSFHIREEVGSLRTALLAIEWPDDELSVFATLRGTFFSVGDEALFLYRQRFKRLHPMRLQQETVPLELQPIAEGLALLADLHRKRNSRSAADTISELMARTRAHVAFAFRPSGEQVLANVLHIAEMARASGSGHISFRAFVERLSKDAELGEPPEAPIMEDGSEGVRLMTVHKAKGLEFPIVILADLTAKLRPTRASRYIDSDRSLCAVRIGGWSPLDLIEHEADELRRESAEAARLAYVAATRARDLLVVPSVGDEWQRLPEFWIGQLGQGMFPSVDIRQKPTAPNGCPDFGTDSVKRRPPGVSATARTVRPGLFLFDRPLSKGPTKELYGVVWWDPDKLELGVRPRYALRQEELLVEIDNDAAKQNLAAFGSWEQQKKAAIESASSPMLRVQTITQEVARGSDTQAFGEVSIVELPRELARPKGKRFGSLVHAVLASVPLHATYALIEQIVGLQARILQASPDEIISAISVVEGALKHDLLARASKCYRSGRCRRETPITLFEDNVLLEGVVDLAFEESGTWTVVDFKTDEELEMQLDKYRRQVGLYARAITLATGKPAKAVLMSL